MNDSFFLDDFQHALEESIRPNAHENDIEVLKRDLEEAQQVASAARYDLVQQNVIAAAEIKKRDNQIQELELQLLSTIKSSAPPPPPPPPPPPITPDPVMKHYFQNPKYLHPLAINLCFSDPRSLHENTTTHINDLYTPSQPRIAMKQFFWSKLPIEKISNTVWDELSISETSSVDSDEDELEVLKIDTEELQKLFKKPTPIKSTEKKPNRITLLDFNRANNIAIMLAKIKLSFSEIHDAICNMDDQHLSVENLVAIRQHVPTGEEIEKVKNYQGCIQLLGDAEQYFIAVMDIPRLSCRIDCMLYKKKFRYELKDLRPDLNTLQLAITELRQSARFKTVLKVRFNTCDLY